MYSLLRSVSDSGHSNSSSHRQYCTHQCVRLFRICSPPSGPFSPPPLLLPTPSRHQPRSPSSSLSPLYCPPAPSTINTDIASSSNSINGNSISGGTTINNG